MMGYSKSTEEERYDPVTTLRDVPDDQLHCMVGGFNHPWEAISKPVKMGQWGRRRNDICPRCGKERTTIRNVMDKTAARYYTTPAWHVKVSTPFDSYDVSEEIARRMKSGRKVKPKYRRLRAV